MRIHRAAGPAAAGTGAPQAQAQTAAENISYFYQSSDGQPLFLHPLDTRCLQEEHGGVSGMALVLKLPVVECDAYVQDKETKKRFKHLNHLPEGAAFSVAELD